MHVYETDARIRVLVHVAKMQIVKWSIIYHLVHVEMDILEIRLDSAIQTLWNVRNKFKKNEK